jgi:hypothetical protein
MPQDTSFFVTHMIVVAVVNKCLITVDRLWHVLKFGGGHAPSVGVRGTHGEKIVTGALGKSTCFAAPCITPTFAAPCTPAFA